MKIEQITIIVILGILITVTSVTTQVISTDKMYLGCTPPGNSAIVFAPGLLSKPGRQERVLAFTPDGSEIYYSIVNASNSYSINYFKLVNGEWQDMGKAPFITEYMGGASCLEPFISPDGSKLLFCSKKGATGGTWDYNLWMSERTGDTWGEPDKLSSIINTTTGEWHPCITNSGNIYFARDNSNGDIYFAEYTESGYKSAVSIRTINSANSDYDPYVDPDEKYLIFKSNRAGGHGKMDNYISYRQTNDSWSAPQNLGDAINTSLVDDAGDVSPAGKYYFFSRTDASGEMDVYWISTACLPLSGPAAVHSGSKATNELRIMQNYPNPFNVDTKIEYSLNRTCQVNLDIFNLVGQHIDTLVNARQNAGIYYVNWTAQGLPSGVYLYRLQAGSVCETRKLVVQK